MTSPEYSGPFDGVRDNAQPIRKADKTQPETELDVIGVFYTIQGEGPFSGRPATFIRLANCNLQCPLCDTDYTTGAYRLSVATVAAQVAASPLARGGLVVITGGEPFRQKLAPLFDVLTSMGFYVQVESNGTLPPSKWNYSLRPEERRGVYIICSPKTGKVNAELDARACAYKYVIDHEHVDPDDGLPTQALHHTANPQLARPLRARDGTWLKPIYLQPCDTQIEATNLMNAQAALTSALRYGYTLQAQIHKMFGVE